MLFFSAVWEGVTSSAARVLNGRFLPHTKLSSSLNTGMKSFSALVSSCV